MAKKIIKYFFLVLLVLIIGSLIVRIVMSSDKSTFDDFEITESSRSAYAENGGLTVKTLGLKDKLSGDGYFCSYSLYYVEETSELQITVRYNVSALDYTGVETDEDFEFVLLNKEEKQDLSGYVEDAEGSEDDNLFDQYDGTYYRADSVESKSKYGLYRFRKLIFKDIEISEDGFIADEIAVVMIPTGTVLPSPDDDALTRISVYESIYDSQTIHFGDQPMENHKLSKKVLNSLKGE